MGNRFFPDRRIREDMTGDEPPRDPDLRNVFQSSDVWADDRHRPQTAEVCDFCRMPIVGSPIISAVKGREYMFCTEACSEELERKDLVFTAYHGFRRITPAVAGMDRALPEGIPRNSFVLLAGEAGTREDALGAELVWRTLQRGEPAVMVSFTEPPISLVQRFLDMRWNILPALENDRLRLVDCFTSRMDDIDRFLRRLDHWNEHLSHIVGPQTDRVNDPSDPAEIRNKLDNALEGLSMVDQGIVHLDSLTEFGTLVQPVQAYDFLKNLRADVCKGRFVPMFGGATISGDRDTYPHDLSYAVDGIVEFQLASEIIEDALIRRVRVRKMNGVLAVTEWQAYEFARGKGLVPFDPLEEVARQRAGEQPVAEEE